MQGKSSLLIERVHALVAGTLDPALDPQSLFEVNLHDEAALQVEAARVRAVLDATRELQQAPASSSKKGVKPARAPDPLAGLDRELWDERLALDRARLEFYSLTAARRAQLLQAHAAKKPSAPAAESARERREREAEAERQQKLAEAHNAHSEAERVVAGELARLIAVQSRVDHVREDVRDAHEALRARSENALVWQHRVREGKSGGADASDAVYDALRVALSTTRDELAETLNALQSAKTSVPALDASLTDIPVEVPAAQQLRLRRASVAKAIEDTRQEEAALRSAQASMLLDSMSALNAERLSLVPHLSERKRDAVTGLTLVGWEEARSEVRHLVLVLRYQRHAVSAWLDSLRSGGAAGLPLWHISAVLVPWLLLILVFSWAQRRSSGILRLGHVRQVARDRSERRTTPSAALRVWRFLYKVHRPLEWALFFGATWWLLPDAARAVLEVQLLATTISWVIGVGLIVNIINAVAGGTGPSFQEDSARAALRLRSLRLVGHTVMMFALILTLSARLVGQGTIYHWVYSTCWLAALPVFLLLVRMWRTEMFVRLDRTRKKTGLQLWVLSNRNGWKSFFAAMVAAVQLFTSGAIKTIRLWLSGFDLARRVHAYLFKRELDRLHEGREQAVLKPLRTEVFDALHPERPTARWLPCPADEVLEAMQQRIKEGHGGVFALVGARGMGKSVLLAELTRRVGRAQHVHVRPGSHVRGIRREAGLEAGSGAEQNIKLVLLDDAHALIKPVIGGLKAFDELIAMARAQCAETIWILTLDACIWPFLQRARDARPLFDETHILLPWEEQQIGALLHERCAAAGITPTYEDLLEKLPAGADELDRLEALQAKQAGYERMLWDYVRGNPALALEAFRSSLDEGERGAVHVRPLRIPDAANLDTLPDSSLFILRAVLQLGPTNVDDVAAATRLSAEQVQNAFRFGQTQGYFIEQHGRVRVAWAWLRAVVWLLERRHLLVTS
ncbi:MAG TPA: hypothetical protein VFN67_05040 [Polyangiales bacterium]|nr:hypothetical protein [Polyangiales bacterium]